MKLISLLAMTGLAATATSIQSAVYEPTNLTPPPLPREFRAAWVATVSNIDWPSKPGLPAEQQRAGLIAILDRAKRLHLNAIILQVRPACDALYPSQLEPWSEYLTGQMGKPPEPFYDPLAFAVEEAHKRGLELHAWFNPYRARHPSAKSPVASTHISKTRPNLVKRYGGYLWLDPGETAVQDHSFEVIRDVVQRYDIDGVHIDDYFYPYKENGADGKKLDFPDDPSWQLYKSAGGSLNREDLRRHNVDVFVERLYKLIKAEEPWVKFGVSPFGIWRPGFPAQIKGYDAYAELYADARKWLANGWLDYLSPQLYWAIQPPEQSYPALMKWWGEQNLKRRHLWLGINSAKVPDSWPASEIINQIQLTRDYPGANGNVHWNMSSLMRERGGLGEALRTGPYATQSLIPSSPWLGNGSPARPMVTVKEEDDRLRISWTPAETNRVRFWLLQSLTGGSWTAEILPGKQTSVALSRNRPEAVAITAINQFGNASAPAAVARKGL